MQNPGDYGRVPGDLGVTAARRSQNTSHSPAEGFSNQEVLYIALHPYQLYQFCLPFQIYSLFVKRAGLQSPACRRSPSRLLTHDCSAQVAQSFVNSLEIVKLCLSQSCPVLLLHDRLWFQEFSKTVFRCLLYPIFRWDLDCRANHSYQQVAKQVKQSQEWETGKVIVGELRETHFSSTRTTSHKLLMEESLIKTQKQ